MRLLLGYVVGSAGSAGSGAPSNSSIWKSSALGVRAAGPADGELAERGDLVEGDGALAEQLEQRQEPRHRGQGVRRVAAQRPEGHRAAAPQPVDHQRGLLAHADPGGVDVLQRDLVHGLGLQRLGGQRGELVEADADEHLGQQAWRTAPRARRPAGGAATPPPAGSRSTPATCLNARYCSSRAKSRSRASSRARSSSSSTSPCGSSRAALRSSSVAATSRNDVVCSRSQIGPAGLDVRDELVGDPATATPR